MLLSSTKGPNKECSVSDSPPPGSSCSDSDSSVSGDALLSDSSEPLVSELEAGVCCLEVEWTPAFDVVSSSWTRNAAASSSSSSNPSWALVRDAFFKDQQELPTFWTWLSESTHSSLRCRDHLEYKLGHFPEKFCECPVNTLKLHLSLAAISL